MAIRAELDIKEQKEEFEKQPLVEEYVQLATEREVVYARLVRAMADAFGEEDVLDIVEKVGWDFGVEAGRTWREKFEDDPEAALHEKAHSWFEDPTLLLTIVLLRRARVGREALGTGRRQVLSRDIQADERAQRSL